MLSHGANFDPLTDKLCYLSRGLHVVPKLLVRKNKRNDKYLEGTYFTAGSTGQNIGRYLTIAYILIAKYSFFCTSLRGDELNFQNFLLLIQGKLEILKEIATENNCLSSYYRKWACLV